VEQAARTVEIPVCYDDEFAPDLATVAAHAGLTPAEVVARHTAFDYHVHALGFSPGFPYLGGLDPALHIDRLDTPRTRVSPGSVGIGGGQTGIYPAATPGGWRLIGRTPLDLFDPGQDPPALLAPGDAVRFVPIDAARYRELQAEAQARRGRQRPEPPAEIPGATGLRVLRPGLQTTVQDLGRRGYQHLGVPVAGAADYWALMVGNWLLGNRARSAALEIALTGPEIEFTGPVAFAITGAPMPAELLPADGGSPRPLGLWQAHLAGPGDRLRLGSVVSGVRSYLCVAGGIDLPPVLGSCSEDLFAGVGPLGRPVQAGDWLPVGRPTLPPGDLAGRFLPADAVPEYPAALAVRVVLGPQREAFTEAGIAAFLAGSYQVQPQSDRQALRLAGPPIEQRGAGNLVSEPMPVGAVQVPSNGQPIFLLPNRQTMGGYPKVAVAVYPDVARAAQVPPGGTLRFLAVDAAEAHGVAWAERRVLAQVRRYLQQGHGYPARPAATISLPPTPGARGAGFLPAPAAAVPGPTPEGHAHPLSSAGDEGRLPALPGDQDPPSTPLGRDLLVRVAGRTFRVYVEEVR
jgi:biotin-dependent carboxylase-like uncharacterized protein